QELHMSMTQISDFDEEGRWAAGTRTGNGSHFNRRARSRPSRASSRASSGSTPTTWPGWSPCGVWPCASNSPSKPPGAGGGPRGRIGSRRKRRGSSCGSKCTASSPRTDCSAASSSTPSASSCAGSRRRRGAFSRRPTVSGPGRALRSARKSSACAAGSTSSPRKPRTSRKAARRPCLGPSRASAGRSRARPGRSRRRSGASRGRAGGRAASSRPSEGRSAGVRGLPDYHVHTFRCGHAGGASREFVESAIDRELSEIAFTDHIPLYFLPEAERDPRLAMRGEELDGYLEEVRGLQEAYRGRIAIRLGLEADYAEGHEEELSRWLARADWDLVLGSVHWVAGDWIDAPGSAARFPREGADRLYAE